MYGRLSYDLEVDVPASEAWNVFRGRGLAKLVEKQLPNYFEKLERIEGDGGEGTLLKITFAPGATAVSGYIEKFTKIDDEKRVKEAEVVEGGHLDLGFTLYRIRWEIEEKGEEECVIKSSIEYEIKDEASANAAFVSIEPLAAVIRLIKTYLLDNKPKNP